MILYTCKYPFPSYFRLSLEISFLRHIKRGNLSPLETLNPNLSLPLLHLAFGSRKYLQSPRNPYPRILSLLLLHLDFRSRKHLLCLLDLLSLSCAEIHLQIEFGCLNIKSSRLLPSDRFQRPQADLVPGPDSSNRSFLVAEDLDLLPRRCALLSINFLGDLWILDVGRVSV